MINSENMMVVVQQMKINIERLLVACWFSQKQKQMYTAYLLARFMHCPTHKNFGTTKRVLRYVQGTLNFVLEYEKWEGKCSNWILWQWLEWLRWWYENHLRLCIHLWEWNVLLVICEIKLCCMVHSWAEYIYASEAIAHAIWLRFVLEDFGEMQTEATALKCDNTSAIAITKNPVLHQNAKHINRRYHFIKEAL